MGKERREAKLQRLAAEKSRPKSWREMLRFMPGLFLRTFVVVFGLGILMAFLSTLGLTFLNNFWVQFAVYIGGYILFQRWIMGPLRPPQRFGRILRQQPVKKPPAK